LSKTEYINISHVWGDAYWQAVKGIEEKVKAKVRFLDNQLPSIVENNCDILCIDQNDVDERIAVTHHILDFPPNIRCGSGMLS